MSKIYLVLKNYKDGKISIGKAAELLDLSIYDIHEIAKSRGLKLGATIEQRQKSKKMLLIDKKFIN